MKNILYETEGNSHGIYRIRENVYLYIPLINKKVQKNGFKMLNSSTYLRKIYNYNVVNLSLFSIFKGKIFNGFKNFKLDKKYLDELCNIEGFEEYAIYTGTCGRYHKLTLQLMKPNGDILAYAKIPLTSAAVKSIQNEKEKLLILNKMNLRSSVIPQVISYSTDMLVQSNNMIRKKSVSNLNEEILKCLIEIYDKTKRNLINFKECEDLNRKITYLINENIGIENYLEKIKFELSDKKISHCLAHKDFTSWNISRLKNGKIYIYDWEFSDVEVAGFDIFHFEFMNQILVKRAKSKEVIKKIMNDEFIISYFEYINNIKIYNGFCIYLINLIYFYYISDKSDGKSFENDIVLMKGIDIFRELCKEKI